MKCQRLFQTLAQIMMVASAMRHARSSLELRTKAASRRNSYPVSQRSHIGLPSCCDARLFNSLIALQHRSKARVRVIRTIRISLELRLQPIFHKSRILNGLARWWWIRAALRFSNGGGCTGCFLLFLDDSGLTGKGQ